ncbi:hypothetical protein [Nocardia transvalensis]|uniref:hypothetical protein n=1 Tax=Nocardia transvalensis TaxID=37333 RepID=UPI0018944A56|nr:hypothetical protein [Nocardia transvalensis]MBF6328724.1 hypothetical protein [Nocardia transvalensis]
MTSLNPLRYKPSQIAKALIAGLTCIVGLLGVTASTFATGDLAVVGKWAATAALFLTPVLVFLQRAEPIIDRLDGDDYAAG